ncbi:MAG: extracellular solute-binding protein [Defluviitaleaceae bacterium]|nr:extracellular solute-binding protein [Defluviitaleaceae bacterium]MCL2240744.1 extracellular solute-binding protein [Defluviitaleaceae bacterium]
MKKLLVLLLTLVMAGMLLTACGRDDAEDVAVNELTVWSWDPAFNMFAMEVAAEIFERSNPGFVLNNVEMPWETIDMQLTTIGISGEHHLLPDIMLIQDQAIEISVLTFPQLFADITNSGINFNEFASGKTDFSVVNGRNFAVPFDNGVTITAFRTDILAQAGLTIGDFTNVTWNQFIDLGRQVLDTTGMPLLSTYGVGASFMDVMVKSAGTSLFDANGQPNFVNNPAFREAVDRFIEMVDAGVMLLPGDWSDYIGTLAAHDVAGTLAGCWILGTIQEVGPAGVWAVTNIPRLNIPGGTNYSSWGGSSWVITSNANFDLAVAFMNYTFAGSTELYDRILPAAGALSTWGPAAASTVYLEPQPFFGGQTVFADIIRFSQNIPDFMGGIHHYTAMDQIDIALGNIINLGMSIEDALREAEAAVRFEMGL